MTRRKKNNYLELEINLKFRSLFNYCFLYIHFSSSVAKKTRKKHTSEREGISKTVNDS